MEWIGGGLPERDLRFLDGIALEMAVGCTLRSNRAASLM